MWTLLFLSVQLNASIPCCLPNVRHVLSINFLLEKEAARALMLSLKPPVLVDGILLKQRELKTKTTCKSNCILSYWFIYLADWTTREFKLWTFVSTEKYLTVQLTQAEWCVIFSRFYHQHLKFCEHFRFKKWPKKKKKVVHEIVLPKLVGRCAKTHTAMWQLIHVHFFYVR